jgi:RNA polymerase sigma-70 factor (ECF subfamily)
MLVMPVTEAALETPEARAASFDEVYETTFDFVWNLVRRLGVPDAQLDDATQDVFMRVLKRLPEFAGRSSLKTWVGGIAVHVAKDLRRAHRRRGGDAVELPDSLHDSGKSPLDAASAAQTLRLVQRLLDGLDDEQRDVLVLTEFEQMTAPEISEALGVNLNTVYSRLRLARKAFAAAADRALGVDS